MTQTVVLSIALACGIFLGFALAWIVFSVRKSGQSVSRTCDQLPDTQEPAPRYCELNLDGEDSDNWIGRRLKELGEEEKFYLDPDITSEGLAKKIGTNRTYLSRFFNSRGISFSQYVNSMRIRHAVALIESSPEKPVISRIAEECGYRQMNSFRTAFKACTGKLPSDFAETCRKSENSGMMNNNLQ